MHGSVSGSDALAEPSVSVASGGGRAMQFHRIVEEEEIEIVDVAVVDDDEILAKLLEHSLETWGYSSRWLEDGDAAVEALASSNPSLRARAILLDVDMPGLDGFGVLRRLSECRVLERTRVIMLTARSVETETVMALELGASDFVAKPFSILELMQRIRHAIQA